MPLLNVEFSNVTTSINISDECIDNLQNAKLAKYRPIYNTKVIIKISDPKMTEILLSWNMVPKFGKFKSTKYILWINFHENCFVEI